ncbi:MAG: hypothetical protein ACM31E_02230 [Fibrobacterota bacterium]
MSVYLLHDRYLKLYKGEQITSFPVKVKIIITFSPDDAFGIENKSQVRTTFKMNADYKYCIDERDGTVVQSNALLNKLNTTFNIENHYFSLDGNVLTLATIFNSMDDLLRLITSANQLLPALISFRFQQFVWITDFKIIHEKGSYYFFVSRIRPPVTVTTEEAAIVHFNDRIRQWITINDGEERIIVSYYYYRQALRLSKLEPAPQTMVPEVILNLAKSLEIIFSDNRDRFRELAITAGLESDFVETKLIPILCLRSKLGIAHVSTAPLSLKQKDSIQQFMIKAFSNVQFALDFVVKKVQEGSFQLGRISTELSNTELSLIESVEEYLLLPDKQPL